MSRLRPLLLALSLSLLLGVALGSAPAWAQGSTYTVQPGDTLFSIAMRHGTTPEQMMAANGLSGPTIYVGQPLRVPGPASAPAASGGTHVVQAGETLFSLANRYGLTVEALKALNGLVGDFIYVGQSLRVSGSAAPAPAPAAPAPAAPAAAGSHVVAVGETLFSIARRYGTTVGAIRSANGLPSDLIYIGQRLVIPGAGAPPAVPAPQPPVYYFVQPGDTLTRIAAVHGVSVGALAQLNNLRTGDWVYTGQRLLVPSGAHNPAPPPAAPPVVPNQNFYHIVRPGETLTHIAAHYRSSVAALVSANRLADASHIYVGQRLAVPGYSPPPARPVTRPAATATPRPSRPAPTATPAAAVAPPYVPPSQPSSAPPTVVRVWVGRVTESNCGTKDTREFRSIVRVNVEGRAGQPVDLFALPMQDSTFITWVTTGTKPELGPNAAEIAPLGAGNYVLSAPGLATVSFYLDGQCTLNVSFSQVTR